MFFRKILENISGDDRGIDDYFPRIMIKKIPENSGICN